MASSIRDVAKLAYPHLATSSHRRVPARKGDALGRLIYAEHSSFDIEDRLLSHLRLVIMNKFRRGESFMIQLPQGSEGQRSLWLHPASPLVMQFYGGRQAAIDLNTVEALMAQASSPDGLTLSATT